MYVSENESAVEKWHRLNGVPMSKARNSEETLHEMGLSKYPTERAFNHLSDEQKGMLKALADIEPFEDYISPDSDGVTVGITTKRHQEINQSLSRHVSTSHAFSARFNPS